MKPAVARSVDEAGARMPLIEHLRELRTRLIKAGIAVIAGIIVAFVLRERVIGLHACCGTGGWWFWPCSSSPPSPYRPVTPSA